MIFDYVISILIIVGILGGFGFLNLIKHYNYELNFKESLLFPVSTLILTILCLADFSLIQIYVGWEFSISIVIYFLALLVLYYITRSIKLEKYIPLKTIIGYILISVVNLVILFNLLSKFTSNISGWDALGLYLVYIALCILYIVLLVSINIIIFIIKSIKKDNKNYKNINYKVSKFSFINISMIILIICLIFGIDYYNEYNYNKLIEKQKAIVTDYLNKEYSNYKFEIINTYETKVDCWMFGCTTRVFRNEIETKSFSKKFVIDVKKEDLSIYEDEFKEIIEEEQKNTKEENIKKYLIDNYNLTLEYEINDEKLENVKFVINKEYKKEDIDLFVLEMKNIFNYIENNFYDLDYIILNFKYGNPFYEGEYDYSKNKGSINENSFTNELWIMVNDEYIFIEK